MKEISEGVCLLDLDSMPLLCDGLPSLVLSSAAARHRCGPWAAGGALEVGDVGSRGSSWPHVSLVSLLPECFFSASPLTCVWES